MVPPQENFLHFRFSLFLFSLHPPDLPAGFVALPSGFKALPAGTEALCACSDALPAGLI